jgi:hypothetical protein
MANNLSEKAKSVWLEIATGKKRLKKDPSIDRSFVINGLNALATMDAPTDESISELEESFRENQDHKPLVVHASFELIRKLLAESA